MVKNRKLPPVLARIKPEYPDKVRYCTITDVRAAAAADRAEEALERAENFTDRRLRRRPVKLTEADAFGKFLWES